MYIRKRSFLEVVFPLTVLAFLGQGTQFVDVTHLSKIRFVLLFTIFFYLFLNKKFFTYIENKLFVLFLLVYLMFCVTTTLWSDIPLLSFSKSVAFLFTVIIMVSVGCVWVTKFGYKNSLEWVFPILIITLISGIFGGKANDQIGDVLVYGGLSGNANNFGFLTAIIFPLILWRCYCVKDNKKSLLFWIIFLMIDVKFLFASFSRSSTANFLCVILFFAISLPLSKKILITFGVIFSLILLLVMMPVSLLESVAMKHIVKGGDYAVKGALTDQILHSREDAWQESWNNAMRGGFIGAGFSVSIGDTHYKIGQALYGREKGNSQLAILEETGIVGFLLSLFLILLFFIYIIPYYMRFSGDEKVMLGLVLGSICGLLAESFVEAWWDSLGPEVICFWMLIGLVFGIIYMKKREWCVNAPGRAS